MSSRRAILRRFTIPLVLALVVVTTMAAPAHAARPRASLTTVTAVMDWPTPWMGWTPWLVADAKGYFAAEGIKFNLVIPATVADPAKVLGTGHADFAFTTILDVIEGRAQGAPIIGVGAYAQYNNWGIIKWKDSKLTPKDLAGKSIGVYPDAWSKTQLTIFLKHVGIGINQVKLVYTSSDTVPLLLTHKVDVITGVTNAEQTEAEVTGKRATTMYLANKYGVPNAYIWVLAANTNFLHSHPAVARGWLRAARRGARSHLCHQVVGQHRAPLHKRSDARPRLLLADPAGVATDPADAEDLWHHRSDDAGRSALHQRLFALIDAVGADGESRLVVHSGTERAPLCHLIVAFSSPASHGSCTPSIRRASIHSRPPSMRRVCPGCARPSSGPATPSTSCPITWRRASSPSR